VIVALPTTPSAPAIGAVFFAMDWLYFAIKQEISPGTPITVIMIPPTLAAMLPDALPMPRARMRMAIVMRDRTMPRAFDYR
jgi:hypothetical protein